jgi:hypothetical protein
VGAEVDACGVADKVGLERVVARPRHGHGRDRAGAEGDASQVSQPATKTSSTTMSSARALA